MGVSNFGCMQVMRIIAAAQCTMLASQVLGITLETSQTAQSTLQCNRQVIIQHVTVVA